MRKVVLSMSVSLDGYVEGPGHSIDRQHVDEELHEHVNRHLRTMGALLSGRVTWELMADFWPTADADPASTPAMVEFAGIWREMPKIVYSRTLERAGWKSTVVHDVVPAEVRALQQQPGGDLALAGADLAATFVRLGLVDEWCLYVHPVLRGRGTPLFRVTDRVTDLELVEARTFGSGVVLLRYVRAPATASSA